MPIDLNATAQRITNTVTIIVSIRIRVDSTLVIVGLTCSLIMLPINAAHGDASQYLIVLHTVSTMTIAYAFSAHLIAVCSLLHALNITVRHAHTFPCSAPSPLLPWTHALRL